MPAKIKVKKTKRVKTEWDKLVELVRKENPNLSFGDALKTASKIYRGGHRGGQGLTIATSGRESLRHRDPITFNAQFTGPKPKATKRAGFELGALSALNAANALHDQFFP